MAASNDLAHWRGQIFARLLQAVLLLGIVTAIPSALLAAREAIWSIVALDLLAIGWIGAIWHWRAMPYRWRVWQFLIVAYLVGVGLLMKIGPVSQIYMMLMPVLAALLLGMRPALSTLALTSLTIFLLGLHPDVELQLRGVPDSPVLRALIVALNFLFIAAVLTLSCAFLLRHLERSSQALSQLNADLRLTATALARLNDMVMIAEVADTLFDLGAGAVPATRIIFVNDAFERSSGYARAEVLGRSLLFQQGPATDAGELARVAAAMSRAQPARAELLNYNKGGKAYWVEAELVPFTDTDGKQTHWVAVEREIDERKKSEADIHRLAFYDVLTGLPNRRLLMDRIGHLLAAAPRDQSISALMFIDLDHFKHINDARGHATGDALLRLAGERLAQLMRKADTVARIGGDEFVVLLAHLADDLDSAARAAAQVAEKIRAAIARDFEIGAQSYHCSASIGVTLLPKMEQQAHDLLREADIAMYRAKAEGRNGIAFFEAAMQAGVERRLTLERALARALDNRELCMHVQPQVDRHGRVTGAELLMRWPQADGSAYRARHLHSHRRGIGADRQTRALGPARSVPRRHGAGAGGIARAPVRERQPGPVSPARFRVPRAGGAGRTRHAGRHPDPGIDGRFADRPARRLAGAHARTGGAGHPLFHRRFRHRLFQPRLPDLDAAVRTQNRQALHRRHAAARHGHRASDPGHGAPPGLARRGRRRGNAGAGRLPHRPRLRRLAGLPVCAADAACLIS